MNLYQFPHKPMRTCVLRTAGIASSKSATFGMVRKNKDGSPRAHQGIDLASDAGFRVYAVDDGIVLSVAAGANGYGHTVTLKINDKIYAFYAHLSQIKVKVCQSVKAGDCLGLTGDTGNAKGMSTKARGGHLHFEVRTQASVGLGLGGRLDPLSFFKLNE